MAERKVSERIANIFEHIKHINWWFGHGRVLGIQHGSLIEQLEDPYTKTSEVVRRFWGFGWLSDEIPSQVLEKSILKLSALVNKGSFDENLIPTIESLLPKRQYEYNATFKYFQNRIINRRDIFYLYRQIISLADTPESIPYLLQAKESQFVVREDALSLAGQKDVNHPFANWARIRENEIIARINLGKL